MIFQLNIFKSRSFGKGELVRTFYWRIISIKIEIIVETAADLFVSINTF